MYEWGKVKKVLGNKIGLRVILEQCDKYQPPQIWKHNNISDFWTCNIDQAMILIGWKLKQNKFLIPKTGSLLYITIIEPHVVTILKKPY